MGGGADVTVRRLRKAFDGVAVLHDVDLNLRAGRLHALVGANGAGKSTLLGVLAGRLAADDGDVIVSGVPLRTGDPRAARAVGIVAIYQELTILPAMSALDNVFLGQLPTRRGLADDRAMRRRFLELTRQFAVTIETDAPAGGLSIADQQMLEILRAMQANARVLLLDEPTASLPPMERRALFARLRELRAAGIAIVLITHNLDEVLAEADDVTVLRDGRLVRTAETASWSKESLVEAMLGHKAAMHVARCGGKARPRAMLTVRGLTVGGAVEEIDLDVGEGEIVGIGGLVGSGRTTVLHALAGVGPGHVDRLEVGGMQRRLPRSPAEALGIGIALVPEDRKGRGVVPGMSAGENIVLSDLPAVARFGVLSERALAARAGSLAHAFGYDTSRLRHGAGSLSGGNQQKLILARWGHRRPKVLLADEPTRGIDVGAKDEIYATLRTLADAGLAVVFVSSELEEVELMCDRTLVLAQGRSMGWLPGGATAHDILRLSFAIGTHHV